LFFSLTAGVEAGIKHYYASVKLDCQETWQCRLCSFVR